MKSNFTNEEFEKFIRQQADQLRMRPSDKVWDAISGNLHKRRRWWLGLGILFLLFSSTAVTGYLITHNKHQQAAVTTSTKNVNSYKQSIAVASTSPIKNSIDERIPVSLTKAKTKRTNNSVPALVVANNFASEQQRPKDLLSHNSVDNSSAFQGTLADSHPFGTAMKISTELNTITGEPNSIESVINNYTAKKHKLKWQFYFTPTISYRKLTENKSYLRKVQQQSTTTPNYAELYTINDVVTHKPDIGLELGVAAKYAIGKNVSIRGGLQFNMTHYDIKAFDNYIPQVATIALNTGSGVDSLNTITKYSNFGGSNSSWLQNYYFQISMPVGVELILKGDDKVQFGIATTVQPTYILGERAYMISSDYQNYTKVPWLVRRWNVNTNFETFVAYSTGKLKWQVGPQVRYQLLSSFVNEYPVKENLFDFGMKVGVGLNK